ncbi:uncharacterized protein LAESUDRAFT_815179 [Laetiporus sulphureus 93-53]|uniref:Uncharacterized protein n=1 Tax=Laetiporus sulphureus 93-53 TaxID=1314785 RepID=A0A165CBR2_9APHY|nr:uncharacterized protein LAESUDRAFT_815179 [Laetiporus sulphureus 93-53]KZT02523.1 hypothetical protein LAESUDRAFT_815179 [Laetiporus sulphureus 93-53]
MFRILFASLRPGMVEVMDGCPVLPLYDFPGDFRVLLRVLRKGLNFYADKQLPFGAVASLVRLGNKYGIEDVKKDGIRRLKSCFCTDLQAFMDTAYGSNAPGNPRGSFLMSYKLTDAMIAINLARLTGEHSMLPTAVYICAVNLDENTMRNGVPWEDCSLALDRLEAEA